MDMRLLRRDNVDGVERMEISGDITRNGWYRDDQDPLVQLYGSDIYGQRVMINLAKANYMDSLGVEWLLTTHRRFEKAGGRLILHSTSESCRQLLKMMRMDLVLNIAATEAAAAEAMQEAQHDN
jgi:anti-anti-sigma factor